MPIVKFTSNLKRFYPDLTSFHSSKSNLKSLLNELNGAYPGIKDYILNEQDELREHVNIFIDNEMINDRAKLSDPFSEKSEIYIMQALSGG